MQPWPAAFIDWSKYPIYYDNPHPPHSSAGTGLADTRMRGFSLEYFNILYHTRYWWPLPRLASIGTQHTALVIVFIPEVQDILLRKIVHLKFMSLDISQHAIFLPERRGRGAGAALKWNFKTDCSSVEAEAGEWIQYTIHSDIFMSRAAKPRLPPSSCP